MTTADADAGVVRTRVDTERGFVIATLDRPAKANALTPFMIAQLTSAIREAHGRCRAVVIEGSAEIFSGGVDLRSARGEGGVGTDSTIGSRTAPAVQDLLTELVVTIEDCPLPVIGVIDGACVGGAIELAVSCDVVLATRRARFRLPATEIGIVYRAEGVLALTRRLSAPTVRRLLLLAEQFDAEEALAAGVVTAVVEDPLTAAEALISRISRVPGAFGAQKRAWNVANRVTLPSDIRAELDGIRAEFAASKAAASGGAPRKVEETAR